MSSKPDKATSAKIKIDITATTPLLSAQILGMKYKNNATVDFAVKGSRNFTSTKGEITQQKPALLLKCQLDNSDYLFVLNGSNQAIVGKHIMRIHNVEADDIDADMLIGSVLTLEVYETGGVGTFAFGTRIVNIREPSTQSTFAPSKGKDKR